MREAGGGRCLRGAISQAISSNYDVMLIQIQTVVGCRPPLSA
jgi:hypothetical protein